MQGKPITNGTSALQKVITIEAKEQPQSIKLRVAAYARVSSSSEEQKHSFEAQMRYYKTLISSKENWIMVDLYADEGITGTSSKKRKDFQRLMSDCRRGKIDRVLTKSISRFARNTKECLEAIRELKQLGIGILFEEQKIDTATMSGEMLTAIFAAIAQAESQSISAKMRWSYKHRMEAGTFVPSSTPYGFKLENKEVVVDPEKAKIVQSIFADYLAGISIEKIVTKLNRSQAGNRKWTCRHVSLILQNEKYTGDSVWQKSYRTDTFPVQKCVNRGEKPKYFAENTHPALIDRETFQRANELLNRRKVDYSNSRRKDGSVPCPIICGQCGKRFRRKVIEQRTYRCCRTHEVDANACTLRQIPEEEIKKAFLRLYYKMKHHNEIFLQMEDSFQTIRERRMLWSLDIVQLNKQISDLSSQEQMLTQLKKQGLIDPDIFISQQNSIAEKIRAAKQEKAKLLDVDEDTSLRDTEDILDILESGPDLLDTSDEEIFEGLVERIIVKNNDQIIFHLKNGLELAETIERTVR